jgi:hypothetical protein
LDGYNRKLATVKMGRLNSTVNRKIPGFHKGNRRGKLADWELSLFTRIEAGTTDGPARYKIMWFVNSVQRYT